VAPPGGPGQGRGEFRRFPHSTFSLLGGPQPNLAGGARIL